MAPRKAAAPVLDWQDDAACRGADGDAFFPDSGGTGMEAAALRLDAEYCRVCPVRAQCLTYAVEASPDFGIWAGTTPETRRAMARNRGRAKCPHCLRFDPVRRTAVKDGKAVTHQVCPGCGASWQESSVPVSGAA